MAGFQVTPEVAPDLIFLDLQMPGLGGFDVIRKLPSGGQYAIRAFEAGAIDYLLKPFGQDRLAQAVERAMKLCSHPAAVAEQFATIQEIAESPVSRTRKIIARSGDEYLLLNAGEVFAFEAEGDLVWIITAKKRYSATQSLKAI